MTGTRMKAPNGLRLGIPTTNLQMKGTVKMTSINTTPITKESDTDVVLCWNGYDPWCLAALD